MAQATATDIARMFGTPNVNLQPVANQLTQTAQQQQAQPAGSFFGNVANQLTQTAQQQQAQPAAGPPIQSFPRQLAPLPQISGGGGGGGSTFQASSFRSGGGGGLQLGDPNAVPVDADLDARLRERSTTGGLGTFGEFIEGRFGPEAELIDRQFRDTEQRAAADLARRGVLSSGEAAGTIVELRTEQGLRKASLLGILNSEYNQLQQNNINQALNQLGVLQQGKVQFAQGITQSNIAATATVAAASIQASAQVASASISANAGIQIAKIGAQASLQQAGMNFQLATRTLDTNLILQGIDPVRLEQDPFYRGGVIANRAVNENTKNLLFTGQAINEIESIGRS